MPSLYVLIPALDEAANIDRVIRDLAAVEERAAMEDLSLRIVLVDDGSTDDTADRARVAADGRHLTVLRHQWPRGPGRAFATGFEHVAPVIRDDDYVLTLEADNTSRLELFDPMLRRASEGYDTVFASPYAYGGGIVHTNTVRIGLSHLANTFVKEFLGIRGILTVSSFFRLYRGSAIRALQDQFGPQIVERAGFECMVELVLKMLYLRMSISEVPMVLDTRRRVGRSKMRLTATSLGYLALFRRKRNWRMAATRQLVESADGVAPVEGSKSSELYAPPPSTGALQASVQSRSHHPNYAHYSAGLIERLDGPYGHVDDRLNAAVRQQVTGPDVLDFGCGFGSLVAHLGEVGYRAVGIDLLDFQIDAGRARYPEADLRVVAEDGLPFADASFDTVVLKESLHHLVAESDVEAGLAEVARVCRRRVVVLEPNPCLPLKVGRTIAAHVDPTCPADEAALILERAGFRVLTISYLAPLVLPLSGGYVTRPLLGKRFPYDWLLPVDDALARLFGRYLCWRYLLVAEKRI
jgi:dolichol-phosphate mannosyltransferase